MVIVKPWWLTPSGGDNDETITAGGQPQNTEDFSDLDTGQINDTNYEWWKEAMQWEENMSNTAYQRAMEDMKKAGLNPMAMYSGNFNAASTPSTSAPTYDTSYLTTLMKSITNVASSLIKSIGSIFKIKL